MDSSKSEYAFVVIIYIWCEICPQRDEAVADPGFTLGGGANLIRGATDYRRDRDPHGGRVPRAPPWIRQ